MTTLAGWQNFYVIVGSSAGALIGLQFVVLSVLANRGIAPEAADGAAAFSTPTIVHFSTVLALAAILSAPWNGMDFVAVSWGLMGIVGAVYTVMIARRLRAQTLYQPQFEDWLFHVLIPIASYGMLSLAACAAGSHAHEALFGVAATALLLLFSGIHNAWDTVAYHVFGKQSK